MSSLKNLASQTAVYGLSSIVGRVLNYFLLVPLYTRVFDLGEYGIVTQLYAFVAFLNVLYTYGFETAYFRFSKNENDSSKVYATVLGSIIISSVFFTLLALAFSESIASYLSARSETHQLKTEYVIWFALILAGDAIATIPFARLRKENKAKRFVTIRLMSIGINIIINLFFLLLCPYLLKQGHTWVENIYDKNFGVGYVFIANLASTLLALVLLIPELKIKFSKMDKMLWQTLMTYSLPLMLAGFAGMTNETLDRMLLPSLLDNNLDAMAELGVYGACYKISMLLTLFVQTFRYAADPFYFSIANRENAKQTFARIMHYFIIICWLIFLTVMLYIDGIKYFIGEKFHSGLAVVPVLLIANLCLGVYLNLSIWYKLESKTTYGAWFSLAGAIITIVMNIVLVPVMGIMGSAVATLICYAAIMFLSYFVGQKRFHVPYNIPSFIGYSTLALLLYAASVYFAQEIDTLSLRFALNTALLLIFVIVVFVNEKSKFTTFALQIFSGKK